MDILIRNISEDAIMRIDDLAKIKGTNRSVILREAIEGYSAATDIFVMSRLPDLLITNLKTMIEKNDKRQTKTLITLTSLMEDILESLASVEAMIYTIHHEDDE